METNPSPAPRQRTRRADRYRHEAESIPTAPAPVTPAAQPAPVQRVQPAPRPASRPAEPTRTGDPGVPAYLRRQAVPPTAPSPAPQREPQAAQGRTARRAEAAAQSFPRWMTGCIVALCFLCLSLVTAQALMSAYLTTRQQARDAAHQAVVSAHPLSYTHSIDSWAAEYGLQPAFVASIILNESSYRPRAESGVHARGLMQLMEGTAGDIAKALAVPDYSFELLWDPDVNVRFGCYYLRKLADMFGGDAALVAAAYNAGYGNVRNWLANRDVSPDGRTIPIENIPFGDTKVYAGRVTKAYGMYDALYYHAFNPDADSADAGAVPLV